MTNISIHQHIDLELKELQISEIFQGNPLQTQTYKLGFIIIVVWVGMHLPRIYLGGMTTGIAKRQPQIN